MFPYIGMRKTLQPCLLEKVSGMTQSNDKDPKNLPTRTAIEPMESMTGRPMKILDDDASEATVITHIPAELANSLPKKDRVYLLVIAGHLTGQMFRIEQDFMKLGRGVDCELSLADNDISRVHAEIRRLSDGSAIIKDLNSTNGTFVNGTQISEHHLRDGDRIQLGRSTILKFSLHDELEELFQRRLYESAVLDGLTQIYNRKFFDDRLATEFSFAQRHRTPLAILLLDIDHFKNVNDTYGHPSGDEVLRRVAQGLWDIVREEDVVARYGGEEFVVITRGIMPTQAAILGERIRYMIELLDIKDPQHGILKVTVSVGVVTMMGGQDFSSAAALLKEVDNRLYRAKNNGRNQVVAE